MHRPQKISIMVYKKAMLSNEHFIETIALYPICNWLNYVIIVIFALEYRSAFIQT